MTTTTEARRFAGTLASETVWVVRAETVAIGSDTAEIIQLDCGNGYGLSIVRGLPLNYASRDRGTWEAALTYGRADKYDLRHDAEDRPDDWRADVVQGWLTESAVRVLVRQVSEYPRQRPL